ncbi:unnamed protein product [Cunninghamella blakesleeana]
MDIWKDLCIRAFDNDKRANDDILYIEGCGQLEEDEYKVKLPQTHDHYDALHQTLISLGFTNSQEEGQKKDYYIISSQTWSSFIEIKRNSRMEWHAALQQRLSKQLKLALEQIQQPLILTSFQRLVLVKEFMRNHSTDIGSVPFLRGLVGCLRYQLYKTQLIEWQIDDYILTQNGEEAILDYIRLMRGILGFELINDHHHDDTVAINIPSPPSSLNSSNININNDSINNNEHPTLLTWRINANLSDQDLIDILDCLPKQQSTLGYSLSNHQRPTQALLPSSPILR